MLAAKDGGDVIWSYYAAGGIPYQHIRSIKNIPDVNGDGVEDAVVSAENDTLYCFSGPTGDVLWTVSAYPCYFTRGLISVPDLDNDEIADVVLGTTWGGKVLAVSGATGEIIWEYNTQQEGTGTWVYEVAAMSDIDGDGIIDILASTGANASRAYLFSGVTGTKIWEYSPGPYAIYGICEVGDLSGDDIPDVVITTGNGVPGAYRTIALNGNDGSPLWNIGLSSTCWTVTPIGDIDSDGIIDLAVGTMSGDIKAFSGNNGSMIWTTNVGGMVRDLYLLPDINGDVIPELLPSGTGVSSFCTISGLTGDVIWSTTAPDQIFTLVAISDISGEGIADVVGGTGYSNCMLYTIDGSTGEPIWTKNMNASVECTWGIEDIDNDNSSDVLAGLRNGWIYALSGGGVFGVDDSIETTDDLQLSNYPNPFSPSTTISFNIHSSSWETENAEIKIYNTKGQIVRKLEVRISNLGFGEAVWDGTDNRGNKVPNGVYLYRLHELENTPVQKMILIR
jgi:outer membrane protein assembly factor BamB